MGDKSKIEWTDATWNVLTGCKYQSPGCLNCYAAVLASGRLQHLPAYKGLAVRGEFTGEIRFHDDRMDQPIRWKKPRRIFVNSMSDLFHKDVPLDFQKRVFEVMETASHHTYQILTKRPEIMKRRVLAIYGSDTPGEHIWFGTSIESDNYVRRADHLRATPAVVRFLSCEPLLGPLPSLELYGIDQVIVGGESGRNARPMHLDWVRDLRDRCVAEGVAFFYKQWGEWTPYQGLDCVPGNEPTVMLSAFEGGPEQFMWRAGKKRAGRLLDGRTWDEMPDA